MGKEGKTKEVVEDREVKQRCVWPSCMWKMVRDEERWYVCVCVTKLCVKDGVCESDVCVWVRHQCRLLFFRQRSNVICLACSIAAGLPLAEWGVPGSFVFHCWHSWCRVETSKHVVQRDVICFAPTVSSNNPMTAASVLQPRIRRWWHRGKVPRRKSAEHVCSWLSQCNYGRRVQYNISRHSTHVRQVTIQSQWQAPWLWR